MTPDAARCRCGAPKVETWHVYCWTCFAKLPYELRRQMRTHHTPEAVIAKADAWLESEERKQAAKIGRLTA